MDWVHHTRVEPEQRGALPVQIEQQVELDCTPAVLFDVFEDAAAWKTFMDLDVHWHGEPPYAPGSSRTITAGSLHALERFTVYSRGERMAFCFRRKRLSGASRETPIPEPRRARPDCSSPSPRTGSWSRWTTGTAVGSSGASGSRHAGCCAGSASASRT